MKRQIKFRALTNEGYLVDGYFINGFEGSYIITNDYFKPSNDESPTLIAVRAETVSQFTNLRDALGNEIYEGKDSVSLTIIDLGEGIADVLMKDGVWQVFEPSQGYAPLFDLLKNPSIIIKAL